MFLFMALQLATDRFGGERDQVEHQRDMSALDRKTEADMAQMLVTLAIAGAIDIRQIFVANLDVANQDEASSGVKDHPVTRGRALVSAATCLALATAALGISGCQQQPERPTQRQVIRSIYHHLKLTLPIKSVDGDGSLRFSTKSLKGAPENQMSYRNVHGVQCLALQFRLGEEFLHVTDDESLKAGDNVDFHRVLKISASRLKDDSLPLMEKYALSDVYKVDHVGVMEFSRGKYIVLSTPGGRFISLQDFKAINKNGEATFVHESLFKAIMKKKPAMFGEPLTADKPAEQGGVTPSPDPMPKSEDVKPVEPKEEPPVPAQPPEARSAIETFLPNSQAIDVVSVGLDKPDKKAEFDALRPQLQAFLDDILAQSQNNLVVVQLSDWWCGACKQVRPVLLEAARRFDREKADIQFRLIEGTAHYELVEEFFKGITNDPQALKSFDRASMPSFLFIRNGKLVKLEGGNYIFMDEMGLDMDTTMQALNRLRSGNYGALVARRFDTPDKPRKKSPKLPNFSRLIIDEEPKVKLFFSDEIPDEATQRANLQRFLSEAARTSHGKLVTLAIHDPASLQSMSAFNIAARELHKQGVVNVALRQIVDTSDTRKGIIYQDVLADALRQMGADDPEASASIEKYLANLQPPSYLLIRDGKIIGFVPPDAFYDQSGGVNIVNIGKMTQVLKACANGDCSEMTKPTQQ